MIWFVYILKCSDSSFYTGATNNLEARIARHNAKQGAKYTKSRLPVVLVWSIQVKDKSTALKLEYKIKQLSHKEKELLMPKTGLLVVRVLAVILMFTICPSPKQPKLLMLI